MTSFWLFFDHLRLHILPPYKSRHFLTSYPPLLVNVVCERPLISFALSSIDWLHGGCGILICLTFDRNAYHTLARNCTIRNKDHSNYHASFYFYLYSLTFLRSSFHISIFQRRRQPPTKITNPALPLQYCASVFALKESC